MKYNKKEIIEGLKNNPSKTINDNLEIIKDKNKKVESRIFIINILGKVDWHDRISFYHLYEENKYYIKKIKITFLEILKDESENDRVKTEIIKSFENNPLLFGPADENIIILLEKIISNKYKNEDLRKCAQKTLDSIDSSFKKRKINYHPNVNYHKDSIILKDALYKSIKKFQEAIEPMDEIDEDYRKNFQAIFKSYQKNFEYIKKFQEAIEPMDEIDEDYRKNFQAIFKPYQKNFEYIKKFQEAIEPMGHIAKDYQKNLQEASLSSKKYIEYIKKFQEAIEPMEHIAKDYQKNLQAISNSYQKNFEYIKKSRSILKIDEFINAFDYAEKLKKIIKDYAKK